MAEGEPTVESIVATHAGFVHALALRFAPAPGLAEDIAQQVFLEFLAKAAQWDLTRDVQPLLAGMTRNVARRCWRDHTRNLPEQTRELAEHIRDTHAPPGGDVELWTINGGTHWPTLSSQFAPRVIDWLLTHPKP